MLRNNSKNYDGYIMGYRWINDGLVMKQWFNWFQFIWLVVSTTLKNMLVSKDHYSQLNGTIIQPCSKPPTSLWWGLPWFTDGFCWNFPPLGHPDQAVPQLAAHGGTEAFRHQGQADQEQRGLRWIKQVKPSRIMGIHHSKLGIEVDLSIIGWGLKHLSIENMG